MDFFLQHEFSNYLSFFEGGGGGVRLPALGLKVSTPLTYLQKAKKRLLKSFTGDNFCFFIYYLHSLHGSVFI